MLKWQRLRALFRQALTEETSPPRVALALAFGALAGSSPLLGLQTLIAVGGASFLRLNRVVAFVGSNVSFGPLMPALIWAEIVVGNAMLGRALPPVTMSDIVPLAKSALLAWWLGWLVVGPACAGVLAAVGYWIALATNRKKKKKTGSSGGAEKIE